MAQGLREGCYSGTPVMSDTNLNSDADGLCVRTSTLTGIVCADGRSCSAELGSVGLAWMAGLGPTVSHSRLIRPAMDDFMS